MHKAVDITLWILGVSVPLVILIVGIIVLSNKSQPPPPTSDMPTVKPDLSSNQVGTGVCGASAVECDPTDPNACDGCGDAGFVCTAVSGNDTNYDIEGTYCLPAKPQTACSQPAVNNSERMQGVERWVGWAGVNVQNWQCDCAYPQYYPMDTGVGVESGACKRSSALCRHGTWTYPCVRRVDALGVVIPDQCEDITPEEEARLVGSDPLQNGLCSCENVPCTSDSECAGSCVDGVCQGQRLSMNTASGVPECVPDTCVGKWEIFPTAPYIYGHCVE